MSMRYAVLIFFIILGPIGVFAQIQNPEPTQQQTDPGNQQQTDPNVEEGEEQQTVIDKREKPPIKDYRIISVEGDTTFVDTTLTIQKDYKHNYLREDNFGLLPFSNVGEPYTELEKNFDDLRVMPKFGARAAHFKFYEVDDIYYYKVPTPWTELFFKTTFEQGQLLDATFTTNISPQLNLSLAYTGMHSLGKYQHLRAKHGSFRTTISYQTKNERYKVNAHFLSQTLTNEQNGGLTDRANEQFG